MEIIERLVFGGIVSVIIGVILFIIHLIFPKIKALKSIATLFLIGGVVLSVSTVIAVKEQSTGYNKPASVKTYMEVDVDFMIELYKNNEVSAKNKYHDNFYQVTAEIVSVKEAGLLQAFSGYDVTLVTPKGHHITANFSKKLKDDIMRLRAGDTLTFSGRCISPRLWYECKIVN